MTIWEDKFIRLNNYARSGKKLQGVRKLVLHYTANNGGTAINHFNYFNNLTGRYASAHFFVDKVQALCIIPLTEVAYHCNDVQKRNADGTPWRGVKELLPNGNLLSIGVEMCLEKDGSFHPDTIKRTEEVFVELCRRFKLNPLTDIVRHFDITRKNCPAPWVSNGQKFIDFKNRVNAKLKGNSTSTPSKPSTPSTSSTPVLGKGDSGEAVKELQTLLNKHGYTISIDGDFGALTESAVRDFQNKNGLVVDSLVGAKTWSALRSLPKQPDQPPMYDLSVNGKGVISSRHFDELSLKIKELIGKEVDQIVIEKRKLS